ncbi:MAG: hypothetical protein JWO32_1768 [Bacteroidetes bacterium]|nr:hypothetical protein [Bacteroidota bacterium]
MCVARGVVKKLFFSEEEGLHRTRKNKSVLHIGSDGIFVSKILQMKQAILLFLAYISVQGVCLKGQTVNWTKPATCVDGTRQVCSDNLGNIYLFTKYIWGTSWGSNNTDTIKKIDAFGNVLSQIALPGMRLVNMVITPDNGFYLAVGFYGPLTLGNSTYLSYGGLDIGFAKYNSSGVLTWFKTFGSKQDDFPGDICVRGDELIMTGMLGDTAFCMGQILPKPNQQELFIASFNNHGSLLAYKFAISTNSLLSQGSNTQTSAAISKGYDCEVDIFGNVYILAQTAGKTSLDTLNIGEWGEDPWYPKNTTTLLKLDASLNAKYRHILTQCNYCAFPSYENLIVSKSSDSYITYKYAHAQSGGDAQTASIYHLDSTGSLVGTFDLRPEMKSDISDLEIDACGNVNFTGSWYTHSQWITSPFNASFVVGQLNSQLQLNWMYNDSTQSASPRGVGLCIIGPNEYFVNGYSVDTIIRSQGPYPGGNSQGFFTRIKGPLNNACLTESIPKHTNVSEPLTVYPNPGTGKFVLSKETMYSNIRVFNAQGSLVLNEKLT